MLREPCEGGTPPNDMVVIHGGICGPTTVTGPDGVRIEHEHTGLFRFIVELHSPAWQGEEAAIEVLKLCRSHDEALEVAARFIKQGCVLDDQMQAYT